MLVAMVAAVSCQKSELSGTSFTGNEFEMTITANLSEGSSATRAIDNYGTGNKVTRCIMEVYYIGADGTADSELYQRMYSAVDADSKTASFDIRLVDGQTYDFLFWADCGDTSNLETDVYYTTTSLNEVTAIGYDNYNTYGDKRDAFFGSELAVKVSEEAVAFDVELRRPFGQLNVFSKFTDALEGNIADLTPTKVQYAYTTQVCNILDVKTGIASGSETLAWADSRNIIDDLSSTGYTHLSTDYIFAPLDETGSTQTLVDFTLTFYNAAGEAIMSNDAFVNIPIQRNYRTNVYGELMTVDGKITVEVVPTFNEPDIEVEIVTVESVSELNEFLETYTGESDVSINLTSAPSSDDEIIIPENLSANSVEVNLAEVSSGDPVVVTAENDAYAGNVTINNNSENEMDLTVTAPNSHVTVSGSYSNLVVSSSSTTCVVVEESVVKERLIVESGNVDVYGTVGEIVRSEGNSDEQTIVTVYQGGTVGSCGEGITLIKKMYLSDFVEGFVPEGVTWEILDETATNEDFAGLRALLVEGVEVALEFPNLKVIPNEAFYGCKATFSFSGAAVESIEDGYSVEDYEEIDGYVFPVYTFYGAFADCSALKSISLPKVTFVGDRAFCYCTALTEVSLPETTTINVAFYGCTSLSSVSLPEATTISGAFFMCTSLTEVSLPKATTISGAFYGCTSLSSVSLPEVTTLGGSTFYACPSLSSVYIPKATTIGDFGFFNCTSLTEVSLPEATEIGSYTFSRCTSLTSVLLPAVTSIKPLAFSSCEDLVNLELATNENCVITTLYSNIFGWTDEISENITLKIGSANSGNISGNTLSVTSEEGGTQSYTFKEIYIDGEKSELDGIYLSDFVEGFVPEGVTWEILDETATNEDFAGLRALLVEGVEVALEFPNLTSIPDFAFLQCEAEFSISAPNATSIGHYAFTNCVSLTSVSLPSITTIGEWAFVGCTSLTEVSLPEVTTIEQGAFANCENLESISLPSVTSFGNLLFLSCGLVNLELATNENCVITYFGASLFNNDKENDVILHIGSANSDFVSGNTITVNNDVYGMQYYIFKEIYIDGVKSEPEPEPLTVGVEVVSSTESTVTVKFTPSDNDTQYVGMMYYDAFFPSMYLESDALLISYLTGVSNTDKTSHTYTGEQEVTFDYASVSTIYAVGVEVSESGIYTSTSDLFKLAYEYVAPEIDIEFTSSASVSYTKTYGSHPWSSNADAYSVTIDAKFENGAVGYYFADLSPYYQKDYDGDGVMSAEDCAMSMIDGGYLDSNYNYYHDSEGECTGQTTAAETYFVILPVDADGAFGTPIAFNKTTDPEPEPEDDGYNSAYNSTIAVTTSMTSVSLDLTIPEGVSRVYYYNSKGLTAEAAKEYLLSKVESNSADDYWDKSGVETISYLTYNTEYILVTMSVAADGSYSQLQSYEYSTTDVEFNSSASVSYTTTYSTHPWHSSEDAYTITLDVKFENGAVGYYFTELNSYFQKDYDGDGVMSAEDCAMSMIDGGYLGSNYYYHDSEGECTGQTTAADNYFVIIPVDANGAFGTPIALSKSTDPSITEPEASDFNITMEVSASTVVTGNWNVEFTPSDLEQQYFSYVMSAAQFNSYGSTDAEIIANLKAWGQYEWNLHTGVSSEYWGWSDNGTGNNVAVAFAVDGSQVFTQTW